jgi:hypothetical protein
LQNYSSTELDGVHQAFNASIRAQQFASGGTSNYQRMFSIVLLAVFLCNVLVVVYFVVFGEFVTDFSEPLNLFALAINSPPSQYMRGSCGAGPDGDQFTLKWGVEMEHEHLFIADRQTATSPYGATQVLLDNAGPAGGDGGDIGRGSGIAEGKQSWSDLFRHRPKWSRLSSSDVAGGGASRTSTVPLSSAGPASVKGLPAQPEVIELGPLDEATAYISPTSGQQQHNSYTDQPGTERPRSEMTRSFSVMARMRSFF